MKKPGLLLITAFLSSLLHAQPDVRNLGFEWTGTPQNTIYPWTKTYYTNPVYQLVRDSNVSHSGRFSLRITYDSISKGGASSVLYNTIPLDVIGRKLRLSAWVKQSNPSDTSGTVSCVISEDLGEKRTLVIGKPVIHAKEWILLSREISLDSLKQPLHHLRININVRGKDTVWVDEVKIEIDGKDTYSIPSFCSAEGENIQPLSDQQVNNLIVLCKVWGFLKFFHPAVAIGKFNWDMELFKIIPRVKQASTDEALSSLLLAWIDSLGEIPACKNCYSRIPEEQLTYNLDQQWMQDDRLSASLRSRLQYVLANRHMGDGYYAKFQYINVQFINENEYNWREAIYPNEMFRLQTLFRYWNTIQYFYPYKNIIGKNWNDVLKNFLSRFAEAKDLFTYRYALSEMINSVNDSHSGTWDPLLRKALVPFLLPAKVNIIDDEAVITSFPDDSLGKANGLQIGDVIEHINNKPVKQIIDEFLPLINGSNYPVKLAFLCSYDYITGGRDSVVQLLIRRNDKQLSLTANRYSSIRDRTPKDTIAWKILPGNIGLVHMGKLQPKQVQAMFAELMHTKAIIFDLRHYPNRTVNDICKYLYPELIQFAKTLHANLDYPGTYRWSGVTFYGPTKKESYPHYKGKTLVLVNSNTQSQAEWTTMALQAIPGTITIGSQTSGADGDVSQFYLTGNYRVMMTGLGVFYPDGTPTQQTGVKIDIPVQPTVKGIREGRDELLEKATELLNK
jgi:carboxyl-terminal processing protease